MKTSCAVHTFMSKHAISWNKKYNNIVKSFMETSSRDDVLNWCEQYIMREAVDMHSIDSLLSYLIQKSEAHRITMVSSPLIVIPMSQNTDLFIENNVILCIADKTTYTSVGLTLEAWLTTIHERVSVPAPIFKPCKFFTRVLCF
jgi:hypothetical protein